MIKKIVALYSIVCTYKTSNHKTSTSKKMYQKQKFLIVFLHKKCGSFVDLPVGELSFNLEYSSLKTCEM
jgi:hypothetical protein